MKRRRTPTVLRGDAPDMDRSLYQRPLTPEDAQVMVDLLREALGFLPTITVRAPRRRTVRRWGLAQISHGASPLARVSRSIVLYPLGRNEGTVLHEFAHHLTPAGSGHGPIYKAAQRRVLAAWESTQ